MCYGLQVTPAQALEQAKRGQLSPVYVVAGEERLLRDAVVAALRTASLGSAIAAFNEDRFTAGEVDVETVVSAARTVPMMAPRRFVSVRSAERWDSPDSEQSPLERLAEYAEAPVTSTCLVVIAIKLDGRRKLAQKARRDGFLVVCESPEERTLPGWVLDRCASKGHAIDRDVAEMLAAVAGADLSSLEDAIERLSLYVGEGAVIGADAVSACVARVRTADTWALVDAVRARDLDRALRTLADAYDPRERGLPLLGALAWSLRQLARFQAALESGASSGEAARRAGVTSSYRVRELASRARGLRPREVERWLLLLADADLALKSSRRPADNILEEMLTRLCH
jgi:DNA polymerase-3 subunit delta